MAMRSTLKAQKSPKAPDGILPPLFLVFVSCFGFWILWITPNVSRKTGKWSFQNAGWHRGKHSNLTASPLWLHFPLRAFLWGVEHVVLADDLGVPKQLGRSLFYTNSLKILKNSSCYLEPQEISRKIILKTQTHICRFSVVMSAREEFFR